MSLAGMGVVAIWHDLQPEAKEEYKNRAIAYYKEVHRGYSKTPMAEAAMKELVALGAETPKDAPKDPKGK